MLNLPNAILVYSNGVPWADTTTPNSPYIQGAASAAAIMPASPTAQPITA